MGTITKISPSDSTNDRKRKKAEELIAGLFPQAAQRGTQDHPGFSQGNAEHGAGKIDKTQLSSLATHQGGSFTRNNVLQTLESFLEKRLAAADKSSGPGGQGDSRNPRPMPEKTSFIRES